MNIAILGFGTVGSGVYEVAKKNREKIKRATSKSVDVKRILDIRDFSSHEEAELFTKSFDDILNDDEICVVVETMGGTEPAYTFTKQALLRGKSVVTSNKELVAKHGAELLKIAKEKNVNYLFEASVGGGIPVLHPIAKCLAANEIERIYGILNGTTNYILTKMISEGKSFEEALSRAQEKGYAEKDPTADVEGHDAARKITILSALAYGKSADPDSVFCEGIRNITLEDVRLADKAGYAIKLIGYCSRRGAKIIQRVSPMLVSKDNMISMVNGVFNAVMVCGDATGDVMFYGKGAGKNATASAVLGDIIEIASGRDNKNIIWREAGEEFFDDIENDELKMFVRLAGTDEGRVGEVFPGVEFLKKDGETVFVTPLMPEREINRLIEKTGGETISKIRVLN